jgi:hypothetical protein
VEADEAGGEIDPFRDDRAGVQSLDGSQFAKIDESLSEVATIASGADALPGDATLVHRAHSDSPRSPDGMQASESFAERLGNASFVSHGGIVVGAAAVAYATGDRWEKSIDRLMERFDRRRRLPAWRRGTKSESRISDAASRDPVHSSL